MPKLMERKPVTSSNIKSIGYDPSRKLLEIEFTKGSIYQYHPVTESAYNELISAESVGKHFHTHIKANTILDVKHIA